MDSARGSGVVGVAAEEGEQQDVPAGSAVMDEQEEKKAKKQEEGAALPSDSMAVPAPTGAEQEGGGSGEAAADKKRQSQISNGSNVGGLFTPRLGKGSFFARRRTSTSPFNPQGELLLEGWLSKQTILKSGPSPFDKLSSAKYQKRFFKLYPGLLLYYQDSSHDLSHPDAIIPVETIIFTAHAAKEASGRRFDLIIQSRIEQWIMSLKAENKERALLWVQAIKKETEDRLGDGRKKLAHPHLKYDTEGKFWKNVQAMGLTYHRRTHTRNPRKSAIALSNALRVGSLSRLCGKSLLGQARWEVRDCQLYMDTLVERTSSSSKAGSSSSSSSSSVSSTIFLRDVDTVEACDPPGSFRLLMKESFNGEDVLEYKASDERDSAAWLHAFDICLTKLRPLSEDKQKSLSAQEAGRDAFEAGDYKTALNFFQQAAQAEPDNESIQLALRELKAYADAETQAIADKLNGEALRLKEAGNQFFGNKEYENALNMYSKALQVEPTNSLLYFNRSACHHKLKHMEEAIADAEKAVEFDLTNADAHSRLALVYSRQHRFKEAIKCYETALQIDEGSERAHKGLALVRERQLKYAQKQ